ncbi:PEP-CTERM sorting domain-containing protein [bacterium]|nr:MAG: PEP-CTERM sorting domain-containing protein [bacterium]
MYYDLTAPGGEGRTSREGGLAGSDSGGGFFHDFGDGLRLVATNSAVGRPDGVANNTSYGAYGFGTYLGDPLAESFIRQYVPQAIAPQGAVPEPATMAVLGVGALALLRRRRAR